MLKTPSIEPARRRTLQDLIELVEALDHRVPRPHAALEEQIATDSARLRAWASTSIRAMRLKALDQEKADCRNAHAVMTDDGAPVRSCSDCRELTLVAQDDAQQ